MNVTKFVVKVNRRGPRTPNTCSGLIGFPST